MIVRFKDFLNESVEISNPIKGKLDQFYKLKKQIDSLNNQIKALSEDSSEMDAVLKPLFDYMKETKERLATTDEYIIKIQKFGGTQTNNSYKDAWDLALTKVNAATKNVLEVCLESTKKIVNVKHGFSIEKVKKVEESLLGNLFNRISSIVKLMINKIKNYISDIESGNSEMEDIISNYIK